MKKMILFLLVAGLICSANASRVTLKNRTPDTLYITTLAIPSSELGSFDEDAPSENDEETGIKESSFTILPNDQETYENTIGNAPFDIRTGISSPIMLSVTKSMIDQLIPSKERYPQYFTLVITKQNGQYKVTKE